MAAVSAFIVGIIFAIGLGFGGMTRPTNVIGFLDIFGDWNPSLLFVMMGALAVHIAFYRLIRKRSSPLFETEFHIPLTKSIDIRLIGGAALFGIGWGLGGYCPAPAIVSLVTLHQEAVIFVASMLTGMLMFDVIQRRVQNSSSKPI